MRKPGSGHPGVRRLQGDADGLQPVFFVRGGIHRPGFCGAAQAAGEAAWREANSHVADQRERAELESTLPYGLTVLADI
jgi:hypothetical protein